MTTTLEDDGKLVAPNPRQHGEVSATISGRDSAGGHSDNEEDDCVESHVDMDGRYDCANNEDNRNRAASELGRDRAGSLRNAEAIQKSALSICVRRWKSTRAMILQE
jgi:hypothetical protein